MFRVRNGYDADAKVTVKLAREMFNAVESNYERLISEARKEWERRFAGSDPSDACVTLWISGINSREFTRRFPLESFREVRSLVRN
jgi:hypothetical protein